MTEERSFRRRLGRPLRALKRDAAGADATAGGPRRFTPAAQEPHGLWRQPWRTEAEPPPRVREIPTMLTDEELRLLYWLTHDYYSGAGMVLDGGCFVGGSTVALAAGLTDRAQPVSGRPIVTYDLFELDPYMNVYLPEAEGLEEGDSSRPLFERNIAGYEDLVTVVEGDITKHGWSGGPIEIAFLDLLKSWPLNDYVLANCFGSMIPGRTILVQQDFVHEFCPWIHVTMGMLEPYFELLDLLDYYSAVYLLREPIPEELLRIRTRDELTPAEMVAFMDRAIAPASGEIRGTLEVAKATLLRMVEGEQAMRTQLDAVRTEFSGSERVSRAADVIDAWATLIGTWGLRLRGKREPLASTSR